MKNKIGKVFKKTPDGVNFIKTTLLWLNVDFKQEYVFSTKRKFRFDFCILDKKVAIEYEGINSKKSGHTTFTGYTKDCTKYNLAQIEGWIVLRYTMMNYKDFTEDIQQLIKLNK